MKYTHGDYTNFFQKRYVYEARPYACLVIGGIGLANARHGSLTSLILGLVLVACGVLLIYWRAEFRSRVKSVSSTRRR